MQFDTDPAKEGMPPGNLPQLINPSTGEVIPIERKTAPRADFTALLAYLDTLFGPLLDKAKAKQAPKAESKPASPLLPMPAQLNSVSEEDIQARDRFLAGLAQPPALPFQAHPGNSGLGLIPRHAQVGFGPPILVGFDAEWAPFKKGRNRQLSVQFHVVGPTGLRHEKLILIRNGEFLEARPSLAEVLDELLDEAECYGIFDEWPSEVILCGFFTRADLPVFRDAKQLFSQLQGVNGTLATVGRPAELKIPLSDVRAFRLKSRYSFVVGDDFDPRVLSLRLIDAKSLAPPGSSVAKLGDWLDLPKLTLPAGYTKSDMERLLRERPDFFKAYALRDAELAALYVLWVVWFCDRHLGLKGLSATASGLGVRLAQLCMRQDGVHPDVALNFTEQRHYRWSGRHGRPLSQKKREPTQIRRWFETFLADAYLGGRNECYWFGPTPFPHEGIRLYDHDLAGCYVVCLAGAMVLDYDRIELVRDVEQLKGHVAGFAQVRFRFPGGTRFPCLPVTVGNFGLWFPLSGVSLATAPEIELAMLMGAEIEVLFGIVIPWMERREVFGRSRQRLRPSQKEAKAACLEWDGDVLVPLERMQFPPEPRGDVGYRPFESFAIYTRTERLRYAKKSLPNEFMKNLGCSGYGKTGQGFKDKRTFGPKEMASVKVGKSSISEAAVAAMTSGFARAVLGEILWRLPPDAMAVSATTDGLLVDVEELDLSGPMCQRFQALVDRVAPGTGMTELKHLIGQAVAGKTRLQLTSKAIEGKEPVVAKGGVKVPLDSAEGDEEKEKALLSPEGQNRFVLDLFVHRYPGQVIKRPSLMSMREMLTNDLDLQTVEAEVKLNMEFDFKRKPINPRMVRIESHGVEHLAFDTVPWETAEEGELVRTLFDQWCRGDGQAKPGNCLKTLADWAAWQAFQQLYVGNRRRMRHFHALEERRRGQTPVLLDGGHMEGALPKGALSVPPATRSLTGVLYATGKTSYLGLAIRTFLAAYVQRSWGLADVDLSQSKLAAWLTDAGYPTKLHDVKNAGRSRLHEHAIPALSEVQAFLEAVKHRFPALEIERFLAAG